MLAGKAVLAAAVDVVGGDRSLLSDDVGRFLSLLLTLRTWARSRAALHLETLALRHRVHVAAAHTATAARLAKTDRGLRTMLSRVWAGWRTRARHRPAGDGHRHASPQPGELATLQVEVNEEKTRRVDLTQGERFGSLGFDFRRIRSRRERWMPLRTPRVKKRTALVRTLKQIFRHRSRPISEVIAQINPILRGWVHCFAVGYSSRCFSYTRNWVEKKIRHHVVRASQRHGSVWKRWSNAWLYGTLGLFAEYRVAY